MLRKKGDRKGVDQVVDLMDRGMVLHMMGRPAESNQRLEAAERRIDELFTAHVKDELEAIAWNDSAKSYAGEEFERIMVNIVMGLNYLSMGQPQEAMVEVRKVNHKLQLYADRLARHEIKNYTYKADAFAHYLAGLISESAGEANDALVSYRDAANAYAQFERSYGIHQPRQLRTDIQRLSSELGVVDTGSNLAPNSPHEAPVPGEPAPHAADTGELVVIAGVGRVAHKVSKKWTVTDPQGDTLSVTYPEFVPSQFVARRLSIRLEDGRSVKAEPVHNLSAVASKNLADRNAEVKAKAVGKALLRYALKKAAGVAAGSNKTTTALVGKASNFALNAVDAIEVADTRSWTTLPDSYQMARMSVPKGWHTIQVEVARDGGRLYAQTFRVEIVAGVRTFLVTYATDAQPSVAKQSETVRAIAAEAPRGNGTMVEAADGVHRGSPQSEGGEAEPPFAERSQPVSVSSGAPIGAVKAPAAKFEVQPLDAPSGLRAKPWHDPFVRDPGAPAAREPKKSISPPPTEPPPFPEPQSRKRKFIEEL
ncbi:MAG: hypothetical protein ABSF35_07110 [Polyangia bacterium]